MDNNLSNEAKKVNLEELSKEDLVKKCRGLLTIAQKAKQTKDTLSEENSKLKEELAAKNSMANDVTQEIIDKMTQQKLEFVTIIEDLKVKNTVLDSKLQIYQKDLQTCQEKLNTIDNENVSYKRQVSRLTDENEQLLTDLELLEKQIDELNKVGIQQRHQLLELESKANESKPVVDDKISELQHMLSVSLEEVKNLKSDNLILNENMENLQFNLSEKEKNIIVISEELQSKCDILRNATEELYKLKNAKENISQQEELEGTVKELKDINTNLKNKLKLYHSKIIKFAGNAKELKEEKNKILQIFKLYTDQVKEWKEKLEDAGQKLISHVSVIELDNENLKKEVAKYNAAFSECDKLSEEKYNMEKKLKETSASYERQLEDIRQAKEIETQLLKNKLKEVEMRCSNLSEDVENNISEYINQIEGLNNEKCGISKELQLEQNKVLELKNEMNAVKQQKDNINKELVLQNTQNVELTKKIELLRKENINVQNLLDDCQKKCVNLTNELENITALNMELINEVDLLKNEKQSLNIVIKEKETFHKKELEESHKKLLELNGQVSDLKNQIKCYGDNREHIDAAERQLVEKSCEEMKKLSGENKELISLNTLLQEELEELEKRRLNVFHCESQTEDDFVPTNELEEQIANLKRENAELLSEMTEMNEAIKERGETISHLEVHCEEIKKKLQIYETQANKNVDSITHKDELIKSLTQEIEMLKSNENKINSNIQDDELNSLKSESEVLKEKLNLNLEASYAESETMSTSTISRTEDVNRLKDLEGSWEERYGKLRNLAVKLKGKVRELTNTVIKEQNEKDELQKKVSANLKTIQSMQSQSDKLEDELENTKKECKQYLNRLNTIAEDISKDKQSLVANDDIISEMKKEIEDLKTEKQSTEKWKKQVSAKVQMLRKELEANNVLKKDFETKIDKLTLELEEKEKTLKTEIESHKQTKNLLDISNNECKKNSVLSLEMQDYERSVKETTKKLEKYQEDISNLKGQVDSHKNTINVLREQNKLLEERTQELEGELNAGLSELGTYKKKVAQLEEELQQKEDKVQSVNRLLEISRSENEELSTELSKVIAEHQKNNSVLKAERDHLRSQMLGLQQNLRDVQDALKLKEDEFGVIQKEYQGYKVRAQSVLRQNQNRDVGLEEKLLEELASLKLDNSQLHANLDKHLEQIKLLEVSNEKLLSKKEEDIKKIQELEGEIDELKCQYEHLSTTHQKSLAEHAETVRSLKLHADTLSQCYRQQISEQEARHNREVIELQSRILKAPPPVETPPVPPTMTREEGEGSESVDSNNPPSVHPVPLERLLGSDSDQEFVHLKKHLNEQESKLAHLTALLSDTEQDLVKHVQMNNLLKEEIRRQQRSVEREKHAENLEYLKNVVFKFVTLNSGDERTRLVPVLNTILKLSPEETQKLNSVAKGDSAMKAWSNYLPTWSSPSKS